jgi:DNA-binding NtrC family response regulator
MHKRLTAAGRLLTLCNLCPFVREVIATACLDRLLNVQPEEWQLDPAPPDFSVHVPPGLLVVDSDGEALQALGVALRAKGFRVWLASRGVQAVQVFCRNRQDIGLVLLDALMPRLDGPDTLAAMRRISSAVRCCFTISRSNASTESLLLRFGAVRVLRKPIAVAEVEEMLGQPASRSSQRGEVRWIEIPRQGD